MDEIGEKLLGENAILPILPCISYWIINGNAASFQLFDEPTSISFEMGGGETDFRLLDQQGRIFKYTYHEEGFKYPQIVEEPLTFEMMKSALETVSEEDIKEFLGPVNFDYFVKQYCKT